MKYTIKESEFKHLGYTFQKLYARDYKTYRKQLPRSYRILCWVKEKQIEVDDWFDSTERILNFYKEHLEEWQIENQKLPRPSEYMVLRLHNKTGEVILKDKLEEYAIYNKTDKDQDEYFEKYKDWREIVMYLPGVENLLNEIALIKTK